MLSVVIKKSQEFLEISQIKIKSYAESFIIFPQNIHNMLRLNSNLCSSRSYDLQNESFLLKTNWVKSL